MDSPSGVDELLSVSFIMGSDRDSLPSFDESDDCLNVQSNDQADRCNQKY